jgi:hypothetical protein
VRETFYVASQEELDVWLDYLTPLAINNGLTEDFQLLFALGEGSFSSVYKAKCHADGKTYCVKAIYKYRLTCDKLRRLLI